LTFVFIHLPKTAGTSLRHAFEAKYPGRILFDYREKSPQTSDVIQELIYRSERPAAERALSVRRFCDTNDIALLTGHFHAKRYREAFETDRFLTILRRPLDRLLSAYNRHVRRGQVKIPFEEFAMTREINLQSSRLKGIALEDLGFVGLTERYDQSIALLNMQFGLDLGVFTSSRKPLFSRATRMADISPAALTEIADRHADDMALYEKATILFEKRASGAARSAR